MKKTRWRNRSRISKNRGEDRKNSNASATSPWFPPRQIGNGQRFSLAELTIYNSDADDLALKRHPRMDGTDFPSGDADLPFWRRKIVFPFPYLAALISGVFVAACVFTSLIFATCACAKKRRLTNARATKAAGLILQWLSISFAYWRKLLRQTLSWQKRLFADGNLLKTRSITGREMLMERKKLACYWMLVNNIRLDPAHRQFPV